MKRAQLALLIGGACILALIMWVCAVNDDGSALWPLIVILAAPAMLLAARFASTLCTRAPEAPAILLRRPGDDKLPPGSSFEPNAEKFDRENPLTQTERNLLWELDAGRSGRKPERSTSKETSDMPPSREQPQLQQRGKVVAPRMVMPEGQTNGNRFPQFWLHEGLNGHRLVRVSLDSASRGIVWHSWRGEWHSCEKRDGNPYGRRMAIWELRDRFQLDSSGETLSEPHPVPGVRRALHIKCCELANFPVALVCECGWLGEVEDTVMFDFTVLRDYCCPNCEELLAVVYAEGREPVDFGGTVTRFWSALAFYALRFGGFTYPDSKARVRSRCAALPEIDSLGFVLDWDFTCGAKEADPEVLIKYRGNIILREPTAFEDFVSFYEIGAALLAKYGERLKDLIPTRRSATYLYGDAHCAPDFVDKVRRDIASVTNSPLVVEYLGNERFPKLAYNLEEKVLSAFRNFRAAGYLQPIEQFPPITDGSVYDRRLAGMILVVDEGGETPTIIHGHHRRELAVRCNMQNLAITWVNLKDAGEGRYLNGLINIAEGRFEPEWIAKFAQETGITSKGWRDECIDIAPDALRCAEALQRLDAEVFQAVLDGVVHRDDAVQWVGLSGDEQKRRLARHVTSRRRKVKMLDEPLYGVKGHTVGDIRWFDGALLRSVMPTDESMSCEVWRGGRWIEDASRIDDWMKGVSPSADQLTDSGLATNATFLEGAEPVTREIQ